MGITVKDTLKLKSLQSFELIAGAKGLNNEITLAEVLDYEFAPGVDMEYRNIFLPKGFVLSTLLFAKDNAELIIGAMKRLYSLGTSAFAFKTVIYETMPQDVIDFCEKNDLPLFSFDKDTYFENIIFEIMNAVQEDNLSFATERTIEKMIEQRLTDSEAASLAKTICTGLKRKCRVTYITESTKPRQAKSENETSLINPERLIRSYYLRERTPDKTQLCIYKGGLMAISSMDEPSDKKYEVMINGVVEKLGLPLDDISLGTGTWHDGYEEMDSALRESYFASNVCKIEGLKKVDYNDIGTYRFLIANKNSDDMTLFMERYLDSNKLNEEQIETAIKFVINKGSLESTASALSCHSNTIRYRINRIHSIIDPDDSFETFYENISVAVKIYLLRHL